ncbi:hypothetical protein GQX74_001906, partial [Glossina fuscipes]
GEWLVNLCGSKALPYPVTGRTTCQFADLFEAKLFVVFDNVSLRLSDNSKEIFQLLFQLKLVHFYLRTQKNYPIPHEHKILRYRFLNTSTTTTISGTRNHSANQTKPNQTKPNQTKLNQTKPKIEEKVVMECQHLLFKIVLMQYWLYIPILDMGQEHCAGRLHLVYCDGDGSVGVSSIVQCGTLCGYFHKLMSLVIAAAVTNDDNDDDDDDDDDNGDDDDDDDDDDGDVIIFVSSTRRDIHVYTLYVTKTSTDDSDMINADGRVDDSECCLDENFSFLYKILNDVTFRYKDFALEFDP